MQILLRCEKCGVTVNVGRPSSVSQTRLMRTLADVIHEHVCPDLHKSNGATRVNIAA